MNKLQQVVSDEEIQAMIKEIFDKTGHYEGLDFWSGETVEECRERLRKKVKELKKQE